MGHNKIFSFIHFLFHDIWIFILVLQINDLGQILFKPTMLMVLSQPWKLVMPLLMAIYVLAKMSMFVCAVYTLQWVDVHCATVFFIQIVLTSNQGLVI